MRGPPPLSPTGVAGQRRTPQSGGGGSKAAGTGHGSASDARESPGKHTHELLTSQKSQTAEVESQLALCGLCGSHTAVNRCVRLRVYRSSAWGAARADPEPILPPGLVLPVHPRQCTRALCKSARSKQPVATSSVTHLQLSCPLLSRSPVVQLCSSSWPNVGCMQQPNQHVVHWFGHR